MSTRSPRDGQDELPRLMLVTDRRRTGGRDLVAQVAEAVRGGVRMVQIREKELSDEEVTDLALRIREACGDVLLSVNDRPEIARAAGLGLHLPEERDPAAGRGVALVGRSVHGEDGARRARAGGASYVVLGTIYPTVSKPGRPGAGPALVAAVSRAVRPLPVYAIGGIDAGRVGEVIAAGAHGVAVCGAILSAGDPRSRAREIVGALRASTDASASKGMA